MPRPLVVFARREPSKVAKESRDEVRRAGQDQGDGLVEAQGADDGGEEVVEAACREVHVLDEAEEPEARVPYGLLEARAGALALREADRVLDHAVVGELALLGLQPARRQRVVGQREYADDGDAEREAALDDEEPLPALHAVVAVDCVEDGGRDEAREGRGEDVARV